MVQFGAVPFVTTPAPPTSLPTFTHVAGTFSDTNYFTTPAAFDTALTGNAFIFQEAFVYFNSLANFPVFHYRTQGGVAS